MPKVSVIIPVYNTEKYLRQCLDSVINQTLTDIEIICVNDGSTDNSINILNEYAKNDSRIIVLSQKNSGAAIARNNGINNAIGEYLYFIDSDDYVDTTFLEKMYSQSLKYNADICLCRRYNYDALRDRLEQMNDALITELLPSECFNVDDINKNIFQFCAIGTFSKIFKASFIKNNNIYFEDLSSCNDVFFNFIALTFAKAITYVDEFLVTSVRCREGSITSKRGDKIKNIIIAGNSVKKHLEKCGLFDKVKSSYYRRLAFNFYYEICQCNDKDIKNNFLKDAKEFLPTRYFLLLKKYQLDGFFKQARNFIFSIRNEYENNSKYKKITVLGLSCKFKINKRSKNSEKI